MFRPVAIMSRNPRTHNVPEQTRTVEMSTNGGKCSSAMTGRAADCVFVVPVPLLFSVLEPLSVFSVGLFPPATAVAAFLLLAPLLLLDAAIVRRCRGDVTIGIYSRLLSFVSLSLWLCIGFVVERRTNGRCEHTHRQIDGPMDQPVDQSTDGVCGRKQMPCFQDSNNTLSNGRCSCPNCKDDGISPAMESWTCIFLILHFWRFGSCRR